MFPHTRALLEALRREEGAGLEEPITGARGEDLARGADSVYQLQLKKKYHTNLLRKMLADAGYSDLSRMTTIRRESLDDEGDL